MASVDGFRSLKGASDEHKINICKPCKIDDVERRTSHYCKDCLHYICDHCKDYHRKIPVLKNHCIVSGDQVPAATSTCGRPAIVVYCTCNKNQEVQHYCDDHQDIICDSCKHTKHYKCKVSTIQDKSSSYTRPEIDTVLSKIEALKDDYEKLEKKRNDESKILEMSKENCQKDIKAFRDEINAFLNDLEKNMLEQLQSCKSEVQTRIDQHMSTLSAALKVLESDYKLLGDAKNDGRKKVMFAVDKQVSKNLHDCHARLSDIGNDVINTDLIFERNKRLASLQSEIYSIGSLRRNIQKDRITMLGSKIQSQKQVHVKLSDDNSKPWISGSAVMTAGEVVLCDRNNSKLKVLDSSDALIDNLKLNAEPWDISVVDARTVIVTLPLKQRLQYIDIFPRLTKGRVLQLDKLCWGVHVFSDRIFTTCHNSGEGEVRILDLDGNPLQHFGINKDGSFLFKAPYHITVSTSEKIFVSDADKGTVTCMTIDQHVIYQYLAQEIKRPMGSYCDGGDNILVCDWELNNVQVITAEGKKHCELVSSTDGLRDPRSISFREGGNTLVVGCRDSENVFLFKLEK